MLNPLGAGGSSAEEELLQAVARSCTGGGPVLDPVGKAARALPPSPDPDIPEAEAAMLRRPVALPGKASGLGLRKFRDRLPIPRTIRAQDAPITIRAQVAYVRHHADLPAALGWTYEGTSPGPTIEVWSNRRAIIHWINDLQRNGQAQRLPYDVVRVDPLNGGLNMGETLRPGGRSTSRGAGPGAHPPIPHTEELTGYTVVHVHGALTCGHNDGWAHNVASVGQVQRCEYPNQQEAGTHWYHDHAMAVTRFNVHAGMAGFYLIRDQQEASLRLPSGAQELLLAIADRNLETRPTRDPDALDFTGRLLYKQAGFDLGESKGAVPVQGPYNMVNGKIWPTHTVEARWHRLRLLNGSNARIYRLALHDTTREVLPADPIKPDDAAFAANRLSDAFVVIGTEGGLLPEPARPEDGVIELGPGERIDVLVDFSRLAGRTLELRNENGTVLNARPGQVDATVMQFTVARARGPERWRPPSRLNSRYRRYSYPDGALHVGGQKIDAPKQIWVGVIPSRVRGSTHPELWELAEAPEGDHAGDLIQLQRRGGGVLSLHPVAKLFDDATTIRISRGEWAVWNFLHLGGPEHPMHIHMCEFQMVERRSWRPEELELFKDGRTVSPLPQPGAGRPITPIAAGMKDTWVLKPGEWISVAAHFDGAQGSFMYHCHILDHEDATMMRPFLVLPKDIMAFHAGHGGHH